MATGRGERAAKRAAKRTDETVEIKTRESYFGGNRPLLLRTSRKQVRVRRRNLPLLGDTVPSSFHPFVPLLFSSSAAISRVAYVRAFLSSFLDRERERDTHTEIIAPSLCLRKREKEKKKREEKKNVSIGARVTRVRPSPAGNFNYTATERGESRFDARPAYQDNGFHRPMVRIYQSAVRGCA